MKKYKLEAEFLIWKARSEKTKLEDYIEYMGEFENRDEAELRLSSLIVERMSTRKDWQYHLVNARISEL